MGVFMKKWLILVVWWVAVVGQQLATVDLNNVMGGAFIFYTPVGVAFDLPEIENYLTDPLLRGYMKNSMVKQNSDYLFQQAIHVPKGYKYGCNTSLYTTTNITCTQDLKANSTLMSNLADYFSKVVNEYGLFFGWDIEGANFSNTNYLKNYNEEAIALWTYSELVDQGDTLANYSSTQFANDFNQIFYNFYISVMGPGLTPLNTDNSWYDQISSFSDIAGYFSFRCIIFTNIADATIANLLSDTYVDQYITNRVTGLDGTYYNPWYYYLAFNDIQLTNSIGVDGVTNSFAAALWTLDFALKASSLTINPVLFHSPLTASFQSILGVPPYYSPSAIYYGLLMANLAMEDYPEFLQSTVTAQLSQHIKVYTFYNWYGYGLVIINKDLNVNLVGTVDVSLDYSGFLQCTYMQAPSLSSTSGIKIGNISFVSNSSDFVGTYSTVRFQPSNGVFKIDIKYAQVAYCMQKSQNGYNLFNRRKSARSGQLWLLVSVIFYLIFVG